MNLLKKLKRRTTLEKITNTPLKLTIGIKSKGQEMLELREPLMLEFMDFLEGSLAELVPVYSKHLEELDRIATKGEINLVDMRLLQPVMKPICNFIAVISDREDLKDKIHKMITMTQAAECINKMFYLMDLPRLWLNFSEALTRMEEAKKMTNTKQDSLVQ